MIAMLLGTGFEPLELVAPCDILRRGGLDVKLAALEGSAVEAGHGITIAADCQLSDLREEEIEMIVLPGGLGGVNAIRGCQEALELVKACYEKGKFVAAICAAPMILAQLGITDGRKATCYPGCESNMGSASMQNADVVRDGKIITGRAAGAAVDFGLALLAALKGDEAAKAVADEIVYLR